MAVAVEAEAAARSIGPEAGPREESDGRCMARATARSRDAAISVSENRDCGGDSDCAAAMVSSMAPMTLSIDRSVGAIDLNVAARA